VSPASEPSSQAPHRTTPVRGRQQQVRHDEPRSKVEPSASELALRADTARHARAHDDARRLLVDLRQRYPSSIEATRAAFDLGVIEFEQGAFMRAAESFEVYLREAPDGPLAREALGRLMEAYEHPRRQAAAVRSSLPPRAALLQR
jgi:TolA-binding protein